MYDLVLKWVVRAIVMVTALPVHECAHGWVAHKLGDNTAASQGRLTLNPLAHLDLYGSLLLIFFGFGWAKPVPIDPRNFKNPRGGMAATAAAGPVSNVLLAFILMIALRLVFILAPYKMAIFLYEILLIMISTNLYLAVFNLLPIPPLDGSKILGFFLPAKAQYAILQYERYIFLVVVLLLWTGFLSTPLSYISNAVFNFLWWILDFIPFLAV